MLDHTYEPEIEAWYFSADGKGDVCRTQDLGGAHVLIDWDHYGNVIGVEVLGMKTNQITATSSVGDTP